MELLFDVGCLPFQVIRCPQLKLKLPRVHQPSPMTVFAFTFLSYFLVLSGVIYDIIIEPPSVGSTQEGGSIKPVAFLENRINGQFIIEGLSAGVLFALGGLGFILLDRANQKFTSETNKFILLLSGVVLVILAYNLTIVFLRMKLPGYLN